MVEVIAFKRKNMQIGCTCLKWEVVNELGNGKAAIYTVWHFPGAGRVPSAPQHTQQLETNLLEENTQAYILVDYRKFSVIHSMIQHDCCKSYTIWNGVYLGRKKKPASLLSA